MNIYVPPLNIEASSEQYAAHEDILKAVQARHNIHLLQAPEERGNDLNWLTPADAMIAEATNLDGQTRRESLFMARDLGRHVLLLCMDPAERTRLQMSFGELGPNDP
ncbi:MAG: hypothetical protein WC498_04120 [Candidatus Saccharimonadales bacterium]